MKNILKHLGKLWWLVALIFVLSICQAICDISLPSIMGRIVSNLQLLNNTNYNALVKEIGFYAIEMAVIALLSCAFNIIIVNLCARVSSKLICKVRNEFYEKINKLSMKEMDEFSVTSLVTRTTNDFTQVMNTLFLGFKFLVYAPVVSVIAILFMLKTKAWILIGIAGGVLVITILFLIFIVKFVLPRNRTIQSKTDKVNALTRENLEGLRVIRAYNAENLQETKFEKVNNDLTATTKFSYRFLGLLAPFLQLLIGIFSCLIAWIGCSILSSYEYGAEAMKFYSDYMVFTQYAMLMLAGFIMVGVIIIQLPRALVSAKRINEILISVPSIKDGEGATPNEVGTIEFKNVSFAYPGADMPVLKNISFKVKKGETIAFIGATGSGKSTLINLIPRFYDTTEGEVLVDGVNVKDYKLNDLYSRIGYVPQKGYMFHDTLKNNICIGKKDATNEELNRALSIAEASDFVAKLPNNVEYELSQGGKNVSGGQRQRLSIARAVILNPEIFIFDDSFSALDYKTDKVLRNKLKVECAGITNVIVAQRVGTIIDADQIIVLENGEMVGHGSHKELLSNCEVYKEIALSQLSKEEVERSKHD